VQLSQCLVAGSLPPASLTQAIAVCKIRAVETAIELCFRLKQEVWLPPLSPVIDHQPRLQLSIGFVIESKPFHQPVLKYLPIRPNCTSAPGTLQEQSISQANTSRVTGRHGALTLKLSAAM
jgi:hypothetical protein